MPPTESKAHFQPALWPGHNPAFPVSAPTMSPHSLFQLDSPTHGLSHQPGVLQVPSFCSHCSNHFELPLFSLHLAETLGPSSNACLFIKPGFHLFFLCLNLRFSILSSAAGCADKPDSNHICVTLGACTTSGNLSFFLCMLGMLRDVLTSHGWLSEDSVRGSNGGHHR